MKIVTIVGTRPNFIKEFAMQPALTRASVKEVVVHTGQHYDFKMSSLFFEELALPRPDYVLNLIKGTHAAETASMLVFIEQVLQQERPDATLVYGDVNSTVAGALASAKLRIPVAHVEAGLRSGDAMNPEEINRACADVLAAVNYPHIDSARRTLLAEGFSPERTVLTGDLHKDAVETIVARAGITPAEGDYILATVHRAENTDDVERLANIVEGLLALGERVLFPVHPRTRIALERSGLMPRIAAHGAVELLEPAGYVDFLKLIAGARLVVSDSGGARREAFLLGKGVVSLIEMVWVPEMVESGWEVIAGADSNSIVRLVKEFAAPKVRPAIFGDGVAAERIVSDLVERFG